MQIQDVQHRHLQAGVALLRASRDSGEVSSLKSQLSPLKNKLGSLPQKINMCCPKKTSSPADAFVTAAAAVMVEREDQNSLARHSGVSQCRGRGLLPETPLELKCALGGSIFKKKSLGIRFSVLHAKLLPFGLRSLMLVWGLFKSDCNLSLKACCVKPRFLSGYPFCKTIYQT